MFYANKVSFELQTKQNETNKLTKYCTCVPKQLSEMINSAIVGFTLAHCSPFVWWVYCYMSLLCSSVCSLLHNVRKKKRHSWSR